LSQTSQRWISSYEAEVESSQTAIATAPYHFLDSSIERGVKILHRDFTFRDYNPELPVFYCSSFHSFSPFC
jgi:hypothetical protein